MAQDGFMVLSSSMVDFGMNGLEYGGSFAGSLGFNALMSNCAGLVLLNIFGALVRLGHESCKPPISAQVLCDVLRAAFRARRVPYHRICRNLFSNVDVTASASIQSVWAHVEPLNSSITTILGRVISVVPLYMLKTYGLQWNWRRTLVVTQVLAVGIDGFPTFFTIWNVFLI